MNYKEIYKWCEVSSDGLLKAAKGFVTYGYSETSPNGYNGFYESVEDAYNGMREYQNSYNEHYSWADDVVFVDDTHFTLVEFVVWSDSDDN